MKVLIALDATPQCREIVTEIASRPWPADTFFLLLHVLDPFPFAKAPISLKRAKEATEAQLKNAGRKLCGGGWAMEEDVVFGRARQEIAKIAKKWKADLVVVGSNEAGALTRLLLGSTARAVLRHAPCAVEIVRPRTNGEAAVLEKGMKVLVATDGSECSLAALHSVASRPWPEGSKFKVISIPEPFMPLGAVAREHGCCRVARTPWIRSLDDGKRLGARGATRAVFRASDSWVLAREEKSRKEFEERNNAMRVLEIMMGTPYSCRPETNLGAATELMWTGNCGFLPVVGSEGKVVGVITDRDICIALGTRGLPSGEVTVSDVMSRKVCSCAPDDDVRVALNAMREGRVRRLPVIAKENGLVGVISMDDVLLRAEGSVRAGAISSEEVVSAFRAINAHQLSLVVAKQAAA